MPTKWQKRINCSLVPTNPIIPNQTQRDQQRTRKNERTYSLVPPPPHYKTYDYHLVDFEKTLRANQNYRHICLPRSPKISSFRLKTFF